MVFWVVKLTHEPVDIWWCMSSNVSDKQCNELRWDIVEHGTVCIHLREDLTWNREKSSENKLQDVTDLKLKCKGVLLTIQRYLQWKEEPHVERQTYGTCLLHLGTRDKTISHSFVVGFKRVRLENSLTWGDSLNMGAQTIRGVEWCLAARANVCVPLTALSPPFARTVCVPMMTWRQTRSCTLMNMLVPGAFQYHLMHFIPYSHETWPQIWQRLWSPLFQCQLWRDWLPSHAPGGKWRTQ